MIVGNAFRIARRELRAGLRGFGIFIACLALGVGAIAAVGSVRVSIEKGLVQQGAVLLGGDGQMEFTYRFATPNERKWMQANSETLSEIVDFRSMAVVGEGEKTERALTQVKGVDRAYPLYGKVLLSPDMPMVDALKTRAGIPSAVMQQVLVDRLGLVIGDVFRLGEKQFYLSAALVREPDNATAGFGLGPRIIVLSDALNGSGLLAPGSIFTTKYRMKTAKDADIDVLKTSAENLFKATGARWHDRRNGAPGVQRFVDRIGAFLVLVGLAGLAVGGIGVSAAVRAYLDGKSAVIATLKTIGVDSRVIFLAYFIQIGVLTVVGIGLGLAFGALAPILVSPVIATALPVPAAPGVQVQPLIEAALYGILTALIFTLWPLAQAKDIRAASLFRDPAGQLHGWPRPVFLALIFALTLALVGVAAWYSGAPKLALWAVGGILAALFLLMISAMGIKRLAARFSQARMVRGHTSLRLALGAVGGPSSETKSVVLSLGLGLAVLASIGQIEANLRNAIAQDLPKVAPSYFFVDIQPDQIDRFVKQANDNKGVTRVDTAPMLRGTVTGINGRPARDVAGDHWLVRGDRGITYSALPPKNTTVSKGSWWEADYTGPPQISLAENEAKEIGLKLGDTMTLNILGRDITAPITNFRKVDFSDGSMNFAITLNPSALAGAPHTNIATVYADEASEAALLRDIAGDYPNVTAIRVRDALARVSTALKGIAAATSYGAGATLLTGFVVLIGAAAAGEPARVFEAAVLKTVGATRGRILLSFAIRSAILGAAAGAVALLAGVIAGWGVMTYVMQTVYQFQPLSAFVIVAGGALATLVAGLAFAWRPLMVRPAQVLRARE
jgi:putative ABC transport system permease protein